MVLDLKLSLEDGQSSPAERVKQAEQKREAVRYEPTWEEVWSGYIKPDGSKKTGLFHMKNSDADRRRLEAVKEAIDRGEIGPEVQSLREFTKAHAIRLYERLQHKRKGDILAEMLRHKPANYRLIQTERDLDKLVQDLLQEPIIAVDTETTGLDVYSDEIVGISFSLPRADYHVYIPVAHQAGIQLPREHVLSRLAPVLESDLIEKVFHNAKFDLHMFLRHGIRVRGKVHDTRIIMALLNENEVSYALKNLMTKYGKFFGFTDESHTFEQLFGKTRFDFVDLDVALCYAAKDTHGTLKLFDWQMEHLRKRPALLRLYLEIEQPLIDICVDMEQTGFLVDLDFAKEYDKELRVEIDDVHARLVQSFGKINFNSPAQLSAKLYDELGLPEVDGRSTGEKTLKALKNKHQGIEHLLRFRELSKLLGTYVEALPSQVKADGRIHGSFNQASAVTGRFTSNQPNLQNLPPEARKLLVAPEGTVILGIDFSQIEPRVLAHMSGDAKLQEPYKTGRDFYSSSASEVFGVPIEECGDGTVYRKKMKVGVLAVMYGTTDHTLAEQLGISVEEARKFIRDFYRAFPDVHAFIRATWEFVKENEYVETLYGRKRRFPGHRQEAKHYDTLARKMCDLLGVNEVPPDFWQYDELPYKLKREFQNVKGEVERIRRMAVNARIQGTAADIMKLAMIRIQNLVKPKGWTLNGTVHDEALVLVDRRISLPEIEQIERCMVETASLAVPLKVDTEVMERWGAGQKKEVWFA